MKTHEILKCLCIRLASDILYRKMQKIQWHNRTIGIFSLYHSIHWTCWQRRGFHFPKICVNKMKPEQNNLSRKERTQQSHASNAEKTTIFSDAGKNQFKSWSNSKNQFLKSSRKKKNIQRGIMQKKSNSPENAKTANIFNKINGKAK